MGLLPIIEVENKSFSQSLEDKLREKEKDAVRRILKYSQSVEMQKRTNSIIWFQCNRERNGTGTVNEKINLPHEIRACKQALCLRLCLWGVAT